MILRRIFNSMIVREEDQKALKFLLKIVGKFLMHCKIAYDFCLHVYELRFELII